MFINTQQRGSSWTNVPFRLPKFYDSRSVSGTVCSRLVSQMRMSCCEFLGWSEKSAEKAMQFSSSELLCVSLCVRRDVINVDDKILFRNEIRPHTMWPQMMMTADDVDEDSRTNSATEAMNNGLAARNPLLYNREKTSHIKYIHKICEWKANFSTK